MGTTATQHNDRLALAINVPVAFSIKYLDVFPDSGNGYGASVRMKGTANGADAVCYLPGKAWANLKALKLAGVIDPAGEYDEEPTEKYSIPVLVKDVTVCRQQMPGQKYADLVVTPAGAPGAMTVRPAPAAPTPSASAPAAGKQPHTAGGFIAGLDDGDEQQFVNRVTGQAPERTAEAPYAVPQALVEKYRACLKTAVSLASSEMEQKGVKCDGPTVQAMAATLLIQWSRGV